MKARGANGIKYPNSPSCKWWILSPMCIDPYNVVANVLSIRLESTYLRMKLKELTRPRTSHGACDLIRMQRKEPYQGLTCRESSWKRRVPSSDGSDVENLGLEAAAELANLQQRLIPCSKCDFCCLRYFQENSHPADHSGKQRSTNAHNPTASANSLVQVPSIHRTISKAWSFVL